MSLWWWAYIHISYLCPAPWFRFIQTSVVTDLSNGFLRVNWSVNSILGNTGVSRVKWGYWSHVYTKYERCFMPFWELFVAKIAIIYCLLPIMRPASWLWDHFYKGDQASSTQHKGFCNYHTKHHLSTLLRWEADMVATDATYTQRSKTVLLPEGP